MVCVCVCVDEGAKEKKEKKIDDITRTLRAFEDRKKGSWEPQVEE